MSFIFVDWDISNKIIITLVVIQVAFHGVDDGVGDDVVLLELDLLKTKLTTVLLILFVHQFIVESNALYDALTVIAIWICQVFECPFWFYILLFYDYFTYLQVSVLIFNLFPLQSVLCKNISKLFLLHYNL